MLLVITCALVVSIVNPRVPEWLRQGAYGMVPMVAIGFGVLIAMQRNRPRAERLVGGILRFLPGGLAAKIEPIASAFLGGLEALGDQRSVLLVLGYSVYLWAIITLTFLFSFLALNIDIPLLAAALTTVVLVAVAVFLPQAPGFVGTWQMGCVVALHGVFDVPQDAAVGYSLLTWVVQMVVNISAAGFFLAREQTSIGQLVRAAETAAPAEVDG